VSTPCLRLNSILALGGGLMGRAKNMLGMGPQYSEMDLPLTETGARPALVDGIEGDEAGSAKERKNSGRRL